MNWGIELAERGRVPEFALRAGIRRLLRGRLQQLDSGDPAAIARRRRELVAAMREGPIAVATREANEQHYEVPAEFFELVLGARLKYSGCYWPTAVAELFDRTYGSADADRWYQRWRLFFLACAELFAYNRGQEWMVGHYLLRPGDGS